MKKHAKVNNPSLLEGYSIKYVTVDSEFLCDFIS